MSNPSGSLGTTYLLAYVSDGESAASIRALMHRQNVHDFAVEPGNAETATEYLRSHASPQVLVVEVPSNEAAPRMLDALADVVHPQTRVIVTGPVDTFSFYHWLMGLGIHDYLLAPFNEAQLASALNKTSGAAEAAAAEQKDKTAHKTIAVIGARGGVGTSTVATALAGLLANEQQRTTALIDLDPQFGSIALGLDLEPSRGLRDALEKPDRIDTLYLERVMIKASPTLSILSAEEPLQEIIATHTTAGDLLLASLREKFTFIVADLPRSLTPLTRAVLAQADHVIVVTEPSIIALRDALRLKDLLVDQLKRPAPMVLVNREGMSKQEPSRGEFAKHLGLTPSAYVPYHLEVAAATARGESLLADKKLAPVLEPLRRLSVTLGGNEAKPTKQEKRGLLKGRK